MMRRPLETIPKRRSKRLRKKARGLWRMVHTRHARGLCILRARAYAFAANATIYATLFTVVRKDIHREFLYSTYD